MGGFTIYEKESGKEIYYANLPARNRIFDYLEIANALDDFVKAYISACPDCITGYLDRRKAIEALRKAIEYFKEMEDEIAVGYLGELLEALEESKEDILVIEDELECCPHERWERSIL